MCSVNPTSCATATPNLPLPGQVGLGIWQTGCVHFSVGAFLAVQALLLLLPVLALSYVRTWCPVSASRLKTYTSQGPAICLHYLHLLQLDIRLLSKVCCAAFKSSNNATMVPIDPRGHDCPVCMETISVKQILVIKACHHRVCRSCFVCYLEHNHKAQAANGPRCMAAGCQHRVAVRQCTIVLRQAVSVYICTCPEHCTGYSVFCLMLNGTCNLTFSFGALPCMCNLSPTIMPK